MLDINYHDSDIVGTASLHGFHSKAVTGLLHHKTSGAGQLTPLKVSVRAFIWSECMQK